MYVVQAPHLLKDSEHSQNNVTPLQMNHHLNSESTQAADSHAPLVYRMEKKGKGSRGKEKDYTSILNTFCREWFITGAVYDSLCKEFEKQPELFKGTEPMLVTKVKEGDMISIKALEEERVNPKKGESQIEPHIVDENTETFYVPYNHLIRQQLWTYKAVHKMWKFNDRIDSVCYTTFIGSYTQYEEKLDLCMKHRNFEAVTNNTIEQNKIINIYKGLREVYEGSNEMWQEKARQHRNRLLYAQEMLNMLVEASE